MPNAQIAIPRQSRSTIARIVRTKAVCVLAAIPATLLIAGVSAGGALPVPPDAPANLRAPPEQVMSLEALASGFQIYECQSKFDQPSTYEWAFVAPDAVLLDRAGHLLGKHYAGPTWESIDGSSVTGEVNARDAGPTPSSIPWLLLNAKTTTGAGVFSTTKSVQRLQTVGGVAPTEPCSAANAKQVAEVPYTATYYFYRNADDAHPGPWAGPDKY
jgi:hypothetical protein